MRLERLRSVTRRAGRAARMVRRELAPLIGMRLHVALREARSERLPVEEYLAISGLYLSGGGFLEAERARLTEIVKQGTASREAVTASYVRLPPFLERQGQAPVDINQAHHLARCTLVKARLPAARHVLDLGGASDEAAEGALLGMGYPHEPEQVWIVNQPPAERHHYSPSVPPAKGGNFRRSRVDYVFSSMTDLSGLQDNLVDLVWSGQSIEHVREADATRVLEEVFRILKPGGAFCLDTPNGLMTRRLSPFALLHPEHHLEYEPDHLISLVERAGFRVVSKLAISPLPISHRLGRFSRLELVYSEHLSPAYRTGFSFYLETRKPLTAMRS